MERITNPLTHICFHPQQHQTPTTPAEERPSREAMLAILYFLYTGKTSRVNGSTAMDVLCLLGAEGEVGRFHSTGLE